MFYPSSHCQSWLVGFLYFIVMKIVNLKTKSKGHTALVKSLITEYLKENPGAKSAIIKQTEGHLSVNVKIIISDDECVVDSCQIQLNNLALALENNLVTRKDGLYVITASGEQFKTTEELFRVYPEYKD